MYNFVSGFHSIIILFSERIVGDDAADSGSSVDATVMHTTFASLKQIIIFMRIVRIRVVQKLKIKKR